MAFAQTHPESIDIPVPEMDRPALFCGKGGHAEVTGDGAVLRRGLLASGPATRKEQSPRETWETARQGIWMPRPEMTRKDTLAVDFVGAVDCSKDLTNNAGEGGHRQLPWYGASGKSSVPSDPFLATDANNCNKLPQVWGAETKASPNDPKRGISLWVGMCGLAGTEGLANYPTLLLRFRTGLDLG